MNFKTTLILLVLVILVAGYFLLFERGRTTTYEYQRQQLETSSAQGSPLFAELTPDAITGLTIHRRDETSVIAREQGQWIQTEPVRFPLAASQPDMVARSAAELRSFESFTPGEEEGGDRPTLSQLSLEAPRVVLSVHLDDTRHTIRLGERSTGGRGYAMIDDDSRVHVVPDALHAALFDTSVHDWRKTSFDVPSLAQLEQISLQHDGETIVARKLDGRWYLDDAGSQRAGEQPLTSLVDSLRGSRIRDFVADAPESMRLYGLEQPRLILSLTRPAIDEGEPQTSTLRVGSPADLRQEAAYATWTADASDEPSNIVFTISQANVATLTKTADDLRDPRVMLTEPRDVREIRIQRQGTEPLILQQTPEGWTFGDPSPPFPLDHQAAADLVTALADTRAVGYTADLPAGEPAAVLSLHRSGGDAERLTFYGPLESDDQATYLVVRGDETVAYQVPAEQVEQVLAPASTFRSKTLLDVPASQLARIELEQPGGVTLVFSRGNGENASWKLEGAESFESETFDQLLRSLAPLRIESWTTTRQSFEPDATLTLHLDDSVTHELAVETTTGRGMMGDLPIFALPQPFVDLLTAEYRDRLILPLTLEQIGSVTLARGADTVTLERTDAGRYVDASGGPVGQAVAAGVFDTLAGLQVERWVPAVPSLAGEAPVTIEIHPREGETLTLELLPGTRQGHFVGDDRWFLLSEQDAARLAAPLSHEDAAEPSK